MASKKKILFIADCSNLYEAIDKISKEREKNKNLMLRLTGILSGTSKSELLKTLSDSYMNPFDYFEPDKNDEGSLICYIAVKRKNDFNRLLRALSDITINKTTHITCEPYMQWLENN